MAVGLAVFTHPLPVRTINLAIPTLTPTASPSPRPTLTAKLGQVAPSPDSWGVAEKIGDHTYTINVQNDPAMATPDEILTAINNLRARHGAQPLRTDGRLCQYAQSRADYFKSIQSIDSHAGFNDFLQHYDGFSKLGFARLGENSSFGYTLSGVHLVEFVYMQSPGHNQNQLNPDWDRGCAGVAGSATNIVFATSPI